MWADVILSLSSRIGRNTDEKRGWGGVGVAAVVVGLGLGLLGQNWWFVRERMGLHWLLAEPYRQLGFLYYQQKDNVRARAAFERYLTLKPDASDAGRIKDYLVELAR